MNAVAARPGTGPARPLVSVIVPIYNHARYLEGCLDSIADDGYPEMELVLLDDGSKDSSHAIAKAWVEANRLRFRRCILMRQENRGICPTLNRLILESQGEYVLPIASDDRLLPDGIAPRVKLLQDKPHALAVLSNIRIIDQGGNVLTDDGLGRYFGLSRPHLADPRSRPAEILLQTNAGPILLVRRSAYVGPNGIGMYDETRHFEDRDFFLRILARPDGLLYLDRVCAEYRVHPDNHVGLHVADRTRHARIAPDYIAMGYKHNKLYTGSLRLAILLDAWEAKLYWMDGQRGFVHRRAQRLVRRFKKAVLKAHRRKARLGHAGHGDTGPA